MSSQLEKLSFSKRLQKTLTENQHPISTTYLSNAFNARYDGQPISVQSANNWLLGKAIPNQDKLLILSIWLNVSSQWLRFGQETEREDQSHISSVSRKDLELISKIQTLSLSQQKILYSLIEEFSR